MSSSKRIEFADFFDSIGLTFKLVGRTPYLGRDEENSDFKKWFNKGIFAFCFVILALTFILEIIFILSVLGNKDQFMEMIKTIPCALFDAMGLEQMLLIGKSEERFNALVRQLEELFPKDPRTQEKYEIQKKAQEAKLLLSNVYSAFIFCFFTWVVVTPAYDILYCRFTAKKYVFELPFTVWSPWGLTDPIPFYVALFLEVMTIYSSLMIVVSVNMLCSSIMSQIGLQFDILAQNLRNLEPDDFHALHSAIRQHVHLIAISDQFSAIISRTMFSNHLLTSFALCCILFEIVLSDEIFRFIMFMLVIVIQTLNMSLMGDSLLENHSKVSAAVYESDWLDSSREMRLTLLQILHRSQKPLIVTGEGFFTISLDSCRKMLMASFQYFALLKSFIE